MNKIITITLCAFLLISATVIEVQTIIFQPKTPKSVIVLNGYTSSENAADLQAALNTYAKIGFIVKELQYNSNAHYLIILEKY